MTQFNQTSVATFEVTVASRDVHTANILYKDWFHHLSWGSVWTTNPEYGKFLFFTSKEELWQEAEAFAYDFFKMCSDNKLEVTQKEIETPVRDR